MKKKRNLGFIYFFVFMFVGFLLLATTGVYDNSITGSAFEVDPFKDMTSGFREFIKDSETVGYILVFVALFSVTYLLISRIHLFKITNKWPGILFSAAMTLAAMLFIPEFTGKVIGLFSYSISLTILLLIGLLAWTVYSLFHKQVSKDIGEFADIAVGRRDSAAKAALAKSDLMNSKVAIKGEKANLALGAQLEKKLVNIDSQIKKLHYEAESNKKSDLIKVIDAFDKLEIKVNFFKTYIASGKLSDANNEYTIISAIIGKLQGLINNN